MKNEAMFYERLDNQHVGCYLCEHQCAMANSRFGFCGVRQNSDGRLCTLVYAQIVAADVDPIENKPLYHFLPGTGSYSTGIVGCDFRCGFCQNWQASQVSAKTDPLFAGYQMLSTSYRFADYSFTPTDSLKRAKKIARQERLR